MDPFVPLALTFGMIVAASQQAAIMEQYAAHSRHARAATEPAPAWGQVPIVSVPVATAPPPVPGWVAGAAVGSQIGALASAGNPVVHCRGRACGVGFDPRPVIAGAVIGGLLGHAASTPPPLAYVAPAAPAEPPSTQGSASSREFTDHWQRFMQPSVSRAAGPAR